MDSDSVSERDIHDIFEDNECIWDSLGYSETISEPNCDLLVEYDIEGDKIQPDFFAYNKLKNRWEIVDLKLPLESLTLQDRERRKRFKSSVEDYISQVEEYNRYFDEKSHRDHVKEEFSIDIPKDPPVALILGTNLQQKEIDSELKRYNKNITVYQYDNIIDILREKYSELSGENEGLPGVSVASILQLTKEPVYDKEYIFDIGKSKDSDRISLYIQDAQELILEINSSDGASYQVSKPWEEAFTVDQPALVYLEVASSEELSFGRVFIGTEILDEMAITAEIPIDILEGDEFDLFLSADMNGKNGGRFAVGEIAILSKVESLETRLQYMNHLLTKWQHETSAVVFDREDWMSTDDDMTTEFED